jgi:hypothetical protein
MEGERLGSFHLEQVKARNPSSLPFTRLSHVRYVWDGTHLQVQVDRRQWSKEAIAKDGWYVTADYSTKPPRVIVTKEPTKYSQWRFTGAKGHQRYYIKNENDFGKDAWLHLEDTGKRYSLVDKGLSDLQGNRPSLYWEGTMYNAVLSYDKKTAYVVVDIEKEERFIEKENGR